MIMPQRFWSIVDLLFLMILMILGSRPARADTKVGNLTKFAVGQGKSQDISLNSQARKAILPFLRRPGWQVIGKSGRDLGAKLPKELTQLFHLGKQADLFKRSLANNVDFYVRFEINKKEKSGQMALEFAVSVAEVVGGQIAAVETAISSSYPDEPANYLKAINDVSERAMPDIVKQVENYLRHEKERGTTFQILISNPPAGAEVHLVQALRKECFTKKLVLNEPDRLGLMVRSNGDQQSLLDLIVAAIKKHFPDVSYRIVPTHKRLILIVVSP